MMDPVSVADVLAKLAPIQRRAVQLVYFEGRTTGEAARILNVERAVVAAALAVAFRRIARHLLDDPHTREAD